jgi:hypothetical protein
MFLRCAFAQEVLLLMSQWTAGLVTVPQTDAGGGSLTTRMQEVPPRVARPVRPEGRTTRGAI